MKKILPTLRRSIFRAGKKLVQLPIWSHLVAGGLLRILLMAYGIWQDANFEVSYTDVDYHVFTDAAEFVSLGKSPYERHTYRYTPLLAWILLPNIYVSLHFGKVLFIAFDLFTAAMIYEVLRVNGHQSQTSILCCILWLYNPLPITVSSRGNAESIMTFLVLITLRMCNKRDLKMAAFLYGLAVHSKIYPVIYAPSIYLYLGLDRFSKATTWQEKLKTLLRPNKDQITFVGISVTTFTVLMAFFFAIYGWPFLHETYLYHLSRKDTRHNFSVFFYMLYLCTEKAYASWINFSLFLPQVLLLLGTSFTYFYNLPFCWFLCTVIFVTFNKVLTSQYFLWYLSILPVILPSLRLSFSKGVFLLGLWFFGQAIWLLPAYYLEFEGKNTFIYIWLAGLVFFFTQVYILHVFIGSYNHRSDKKNALKKSK